MIMAKAEWMKACFIITEGMWSSLALKKGDGDKPDGGAAGGGRMAMLALWWGGYVGTMVGWLCWHSVGVAMLAQCQGHGCTCVGA